MKLTVEGNICNAIPESFGTYSERKNSVTTLHFFVGANLADTDTACALYTKPTVVTTAVDIDLPIVDRELIKEAFTFTVPDTRKDARGMKKVLIRLFEKNRQLQFEVL